MERNLREKEDIIDKQEWDKGMTQCPTCKKKFLIVNRSDYVYKTRSNKGNLLFYCSYSCLNKGKIEIDKNRKYKSKHFCVI